MNDEKKPFVRKISDAERAEIRKEHDSWLRTIMIGAIDGVLIGIAVGIAIIVTDINGIGTMLNNSSNQIGYTLLLLAGLASMDFIHTHHTIWITRDTLKSCSKKS